LSGQQSPGREKNPDATPTGIALSLGLRQSHQSFSKSL
jgi:hypothetical protein